MKPNPRNFNILYHDDGPKPPSEPQASPIEATEDNQPVNPKLLSMKPTPRSYNILYHDGGPKYPSDQPDRSSAPTSMEATQPPTAKAQSMKPPARDYNILFHVQTAPIDNSNPPTDRMSPTNEDVSLHDQSYENNSIEQQGNLLIHYFLKTSLAII